MVGSESNASNSGLQVAGPQESEAGLTVELLAGETEDAGCPRPGPHLAEDVAVIPSALAVKG